MIEDDGIDLIGIDALTDFFDLAGADERGRVECRTSLEGAAKYVGTGTFGQGCELVERLFGVGIDDGRVRRVGTPTSGKLDADD